MNHVEVTLYFNELHLKAVQEELAADGLTLEDKLKEHFAFLYDQLVPPEKQLGIEAEIEQIEAQENAEREARRNFGVFHVHENGSDRYFTSELFDSLLSTAYRYRLYDRGELSSNPKMFAEAFGEVEHISAAQYEELCDRMPNDHRIKIAADYDLDAGMVTTCQSSDNAWWSYRLRDLSVAAFKAHRSNYRGSNSREKIFDQALVGKEIDPPEAAEHIVPQSGVIHICENGKDTYFITHGTHSFLTAANLYRQYENGTAIGKPTTFASTFGGVEKISMEAFDAHSDHIPYDPQIKFSAEFFLDGGVCSLLDSNDNCWWFYDLKDVCEAAQKAYRQSDLPMSKRQEVFDNILIGKELDPDEWVERKHEGNSDGNGEAPVMRM